MKTPGGRPFEVLGNPEIITMDRLAIVTARLDSDPRVASVSVVAVEAPSQDFLRATAPAGVAVVAATDISALAGPIDESFSPEALGAWARTASDRGLWHDWWLTDARDVASCPEFLEASQIDRAEVADLASSRYAALSTERSDPESICLTIDATWLGPHQTGAQVLTTAAIDALAVDPRVTSIRLVGIHELPAYAQHLAELEGLSISTHEEAAAQGPTDAIWYPNQVDQRVDIGAARSLGRRIITTYLDLIAYDIPRYHASSDAWAAYRALQRRIALSVDGITTISGDVASRLLEEVPRLDSRRVQPIVLGLDHITSRQSPPGSDLDQLRTRIKGRPFVLVLGNDFQHKNRDFAIEVWERVLSEGVNCDLVLAGLHVRSSSSRERETELLGQHTNLRGRAHVLGHVSPESREWLLGNAAAVLYPSSAEGFGFVPYEAAALGTPSTFAEFGPLAEISGIQDVPSAWSVEAFAQDLAALLEDPDCARTRVNDLRAAITQSSWRDFASQLVTFIQRIEAMPPAPAALVGGTASDAAALAAVLSSKTWRITEPLRRWGNRRSRS